MAVLTSSQTEAIAARGNVIVVAGAGTGKTSTLVERCVALLDQGCSIERILMVTFTDAAAAEMRHRLQGRLAEVLAQSDPDRINWWQEQLALLDTSNIRTLHGFCLQLLRENFHLLGIDPAVRVLDEQQTRPLIEEALDAALEPHFSGKDDLSIQVRALINRYGDGDVDRIRFLLLKLHNYAQSLDAPGRWFEAQLASFAQTEPEHWRAWLRAEIVPWAESWLAEVERAGAAQNLARCVQALRSLCRGDLLTPARATSEGGEKPASPSIFIATLLEEIVAADADWPNGEKTRLRKNLGRFFEEAAFLASQLADDGLGKDWTSVREPLRALLMLAQEFGTRFAAAKRDLGGIDFADLEQFALRLLWDESGQLTDVAKEWCGRFDHVFVDECQDINAAQDGILRALSCNGEKHNRFLVGDVKQSIYQFRLARPALFRGYEQQWEDGKQGQRILLSENFRSDPQIIAFVNELFTSLMRNDVGGVEYEALAAGRVDGVAPRKTKSGAPTSERQVKFWLLPKAEQEPDDDNDENEELKKSVPENLLAVEREARLVALQLRALRESKTKIWDKELKVRRRVEWRDMAVLLRSPRSRVEAFAQEFHKCGVPLVAARGGFFESTEIHDLLSLLRLLDNPLQDIPLLAVLRSPIVALTLDELAELRAASKEKRFWKVVKDFHHIVSVAETEPSATARSAWTKVEWFLQSFQVWRELSRQMALSQCLEKALQDSHYEAVIAAGERGAERAANIRKFIAMVREYDPYQRQGLFRFLKFVDALNESEQDVKPAPPQSEDAVRLMSIHQSKGLEFPVVVVACLGGLFHIRDLSADVLLDEEFGVCAKVVQPETGARHPTLAHWLAARRQQQQVLGEELRLLYVAMTRARDHLLLTATATRKEYDTWEAAEKRTFTNREILKVRSPLDWLMLWLPTVTRNTDWQDSPGLPIDGMLNDGGVAELLAWIICREQMALPQPAAGAPVQAAVAVAGTVEQVKARIRWHYPHALAATVTAKTTVTALRRKAGELTDEDAQVWVIAQEAQASEPRASSALGAATVGTLHHRFLQNMSLTGACDSADLRAQLEELTGRGVFTAPEAAELDIMSLAEFWDGEVGREVRANLSHAKRELQFTARFTPNELERLTGEKVLPALTDEFVVVQGVADLVVMLDHEMWLLDFKTDRINESELSARSAAYKPQLNIYAAALAEIYGKPVTRQWLHFLSPRKTVLL